MRHKSYGGVLPPLIENKCTSYGECGRHVDKATCKACLRHDTAKGSAGARESCRWEASRRWEVGERDITVRTTKRTHQSKQGGRVPKQSTQQANLLTTPTRQQTWPWPLATTWLRGEFAESTKINLTQCRTCHTPKRPNRWTKVGSAGQ